LLDRWRASYLADRWAKTNSRIVDVYPFIIGKDECSLASNSFNFQAKQSNDIIEGK